MISAVFPAPPLLPALTADPAVASGRLAAEALPASLRDVEVTTGCAADYDGWLAEAV